MIDIVLEEDALGYDYKGYFIQYSLDTGLFSIVDEDSVISGGFSSEKDAEEFINKLIDNRSATEVEEEGDDESLVDEENDLPVNSTTLKMLDKKYKDCKGTIYILKSEYSNQYATKSGIGNIDDPDLMIYKSAKLARQSRLRRSSDYGIEEVELVNGSIKFK